MLNGLDLFSGIGGLTIALSEWIRPIAYCENDRYAQAVLLSRMHCGDIPIAPICTDIRELSGHDIEGNVDILYGGFPCQDISECRDGNGLDGERSGLFFEIMRLAEEIKPHFIFLENVRNIRAKGLEEIANHISDRGYDCRWDILPAYTDTKGFEGERWFCLAKAQSIGSQAGRTQERKRPASTQLQFDIQNPFWETDANRIYGASNGLQIRSHAIRALGNAVVPHQAKAAFERLMGLT
jgi:DNA (cytosine-5)-methyltransferase 1